MKQCAPRILALSLVLLIMAGCSFSPKTGTPGDGTTRPVELTLLSWSGADLEATQAMIESYTAGHPNVRIKMKDIRQNQMVMKSGEVNTALLDGIDLAILPQDLASRYKAANMLQDLSTLRLPRAESLAGTLLDEMGQEKGRRYGVPISLTPAYIEIKESAFQQAGITIPPLDWTIQDMEHLLAAAKAAGLKVNLSQIVMLEPLVRAYGGQLYDSSQNTWTLDTPEVRQGLDEVAKLTQGGWLSGGGVGIVVGGGPEAPVLQVIPPDGPGDSDNRTVLPLPKGPKGRATPVGATLAVVNKNSPNAEVAVDFVREMLSNPAAQMALAKAGIRPVTADKAAMEAWREKVGGQKAQAYDLMLQSGYPSPPMRTYFSLTQDLKPYLTGASSLEQILPGLQTAYPR